MIGEGGSDALPDPPHCVGAEAVPALRLKAIHRLYQADVSLLDEVGVGEATITVLLADADDQAKVGLNEHVAGFLHGAIARDARLPGAWRR